jgi:hypothetical protein
MALPGLLVLPVVYHFGVTPILNQQDTKAQTWLPASREFTKSNLRQFVSL